ncbi:ABC transporter ATP-binding protein [Jatrophihabitans cynanchi]|uniref:ABC transporter ATP-binding protein n=1 Tax=Jatrophihabitans cynanchi TaxID=2944128 RepID=A0ABY7JW73_9ACTN|nr:ABC transporter ATP-binding protein [Jatrophihabitans sp. SB3-54]WAX55161.1 ABC transporter ATP-binding protein [Jatrophihabitans sp. SB3-54]
MTPALLEVADLSVQIGRVHAVTNATFAVGEGEFFGVVGESGSGKSMTARAIIGLLPAGAVMSGSIRLAGEELTAATRRRLRELRGGSIGFVFQDALAALDPVYTIGKQLAEIQRTHGSVGAAAARRRSLDLLGEVGISDPARCLDSYPHQLSGGMRQRAVIATALISDPRLIIADEPTTALDVTIQRQVLELLQQIVEQRKTAVMLITHDLGVVAETCDRVAVFYGGVIVEEALTVALFAEPRHPYTRALLDSLPKLGQQRTFRAIPGAPIRVVGRLTSCPFAPRCAHATASCASALPAETDLGDRRFRCCESPQVGE